MNKLATILLTILLILLIPLATATTIQGTIYNEVLEIEKDVLLEIDTTPQQKFLAKDGTYTFEVPVGKYNIKATKGFISTSEEIEINLEGVFVFDIFLLPDFTNEEDLWQDTETDFFGEETATETEVEKESKYALWRYLVAGGIIIFAVHRLIKARKKYGRLKIFRKKVKTESKKTIEQHKEELAREPGYTDNALEIIKKHDGRITQKELRKELLYLSEAKVSLIVTELEHKGMIEKVKKGRGNVLLLKDGT